MYFAFHGYDKKDHLAVRMKNREAHIQWLKGISAVLAGPLINEDEKMCGSMVVIEAENLMAAKEIFRQDPYAKAGLFESADVTGWNWVIGKTE